MIDIFLDFPIKIQFFLVLSIDVINILIIRNKIFVKMKMKINKNTKKI